MEMFSKFSSWLSHLIGSLSGWIVTYDLANQIHPVFKRENFPDADYDALIPALRMASMLITAPCLLDYWHAVFFPASHVLHHWVKEGESFTHYFRKDAGLSSKNIVDTRNTLMCLAKHVTFHRWTFSDETTNGEAVARDDQIQNDCPNCISLKRCGTDIRYNAVKYDEICRLYREYESFEEGRMPFKLLRLYFQFAVLLLHEVAHAAHYATYGKGGTVSFEDLAVSEEGFDWEYLVFGGLPLTEEGNLLLQKWPNASKANLYQADNAPIAVNRVLSGTRTKYWRIPDKYIAELFQTDFWDEVVEANGAKALKVPKGAGCISPKYCCCSRCYIWQGLGWVWWVVKWSGCTVVLLWCAFLVLLPIWLYGTSAWRLFLNVPVQS